MITLPWWALAMICLGCVLGTAVVMACCAVAGRSDLDAETVRRIELQEVDR